ncbi:MAG: MFS transporter [Gammaproteobacteria bacterium]
MTAAASPGPTGSATPASEVGLYRVGPLVMRGDVSPKNVWTLFFVSFFGIAMMNTVGVMQPYVFNEILRIPLDEQGSLAGNLTVLQEIVALILLGPAGALSDRFGRKPIFGAGFLLLGLGYCLYPLANASWELAIFRLFIASGVSCVNVMLVAVANDYPIERSRAKMIAAVFIFNGLGIASLPRLIGGLPNRFIEMGIDSVWAGRFAFWCVTAICVTLASVLFWGLRPGAPAQLGKREPLLSTLKIGLAAGRNPRVALAYTAGLVSRADLAVVSTFLTLWLVQEGIAQGLSTGDALKKATLFYVIIQAMAVPWAPIFGWILDRVDRVAGLAGAMILAGIGYSSLGMLENPLGNGMYIAAAFVGMGEMAANISATSLIGKEAPDRGRGAVLGLYSFSGALGIMLVALIGGWLFDNWKPVGPFLLMAGANCVMFTLAMFTWFATRGRPTPAVAPAAAEG